MADCMAFPDTLDEFMEQYQFKDSEEIYTNGAMLIPVFRVKQWAEHAEDVCEMEGDSNTPNALEALERIMNFCEEIDLHLPEAERSGYKMLPDYEVVRKALTERKRGRWIDLHPQGDSRFMCSVCKWKEHVPTCMGEPTVWEYCPSCGARMDGDGNG